MTDEIVDYLLSKINLYIKENKLEQAIEDAKDIIVLQPNQAVSWYSLASASYNADHFDEGLAAISKAAELEPKKAQIWVLGGYLLIATRQYREAIEAFNYVLSLEENNFEACFGLFVSYTILEKEKEAKEYFQKVQQLNTPLTIKMLQEFYEKFFKESKIINHQVKEDLEILIKRKSIE